MKFSVNNYFKSHLEIFNKIDISSIENALDIVGKKFDNGFKIFTCGNGGSAHNASHFITDWNKFITEAPWFAKFQSIIGRTDNSG